MRHLHVVGKASAVVLAVGLVAAALTGCTTDPTQNCSGALPTGSEVGMVTASGALGSRPHVSVPTPVLTSTSQREVLKLGSGSTVHPGTSIEFTYTAINGQTGAVAGRSTSEQWLPITDNAISKGLECVPAGSRVAIVLSPSDAQTGAAVSGVYVIDVLKVFPSRATGAVRPSRSGFPTVILAPNGQPGISINPNDVPPTRVHAEILKAGSGETVEATDQVVLQYTAVGWESKAVLTSTWTSGSADLADVSSGQSVLQNQQNTTLPTDLMRQLVGRRVGSQLLVEVPQSQGTTAAAWVVDILGVRR